MHVYVWEHIRQPSSPEPLDGFEMKYSRSLTCVVDFCPDPPRGGSSVGPK